MLTRSLRAFRQWFVQRQEDRFLSGFNSGELMDGMVRRHELLSALDAPKETDSLMLRMAEKRGLRARVIENDSRRAMLMTGICSRCRHRALCQRWLDGRAKKAKADRFCPNARHFVHLRERFGDTPDPRPASRADTKLERRLN